MRSPRRLVLPVCLLAAAVLSGCAGDPTPAGRAWQRSVTQNAFHPDTSRGTLAATDGLGTSVFTSEQPAAVAAGSEE